MMKCRVICFLCFFFCIAVVQSQTKNEKEIRIALSSFPKQAQETLELFPKPLKRVKYYKEIDGQVTSFETKFKWKGKRYSIEFNNNGILEDIEVLIKKRHINTFSIDGIEDYFSSEFTKVRFIRIQEQYVYNPKDSVKSFLNLCFSESKTILPNYEIVAEVKKNKQRQIIEFTFNQQGALQSSRILKPSSYEHVLY